MKQSELVDNDVYLYTGKTFRVRETRKEDLPIWYKWFNDQEITKELLHGVVPNTLENQENFRLTHISGQNKIIFSLVDINSPKLIGTCSINVTHHWLNGNAEISLVVGEKEFQKGLMYMEVTAWQLDHAFFMMNMHSVFSSTSTENKTVIMTLERMGFKRVGGLRECSYRNGEYYGTVFHDILKDEWVAVRN